MHQQIMIALGGGGGGGGGGVTEFNTYVSGLAPNLWWRCNETSGTTLANSGSESSANMTTVLSPTLNVGPASGLAGIGNGVSFDGSTQRARTANFFTIPTGTGDFTMVIFVAFPNLSATNGYLFGNGNGGDLIFGFVGGTVEFFATGYTGTNPRTGSGISISDNNVHMIVYRRSGSNWAGYRDDTNIFSLTSSFTLTTGSRQPTFASSSTNSNPCPCTIYDMQIYTRALSSGEMTGIWDKARGL